MKTHSITADRIRDLIRYDAEEGRFFWRMSRVGGGCEEGREVGIELASNGHRMISIDGWDFTAQRIAWAVHYGELPTGKLTFRDKNRHNCRVTNLMLVAGANGFDHRTKEGRSAYGKAWRKANPDRAKELDLLKMFGITLAEYGAMLVAQGGVCAICQQPETEMRSGKLKALAVDHDHTTGTLRGLLCVACNTGLGKLGEDRDRLLSAIRYLDRHNGRAGAAPLTVVKERA